MKTVFEYDGMVKVEQHEDKSALFRVTYGLQRRDALTYAEAAGELGRSLFHHLCCKGLVNNEGR